MLMWALFRVVFLALIDASLVNLGILSAFYIRFMDEGVPVEYIASVVRILILSTIIYILFFNTFRLYKRVWSYASMGELLAVIYAVSAGTLGTIALTYFLSSHLPRGVILLSWSFNIILIGGSRFAWRLYIDRKKANGNKPGRRALIIGAGDAGAMVARELFKNPNIDLMPVGFIDDDPSKTNLSLLGIPVFGDRKAIDRVVTRHDIDEIIIAMPSVEGRVIREIIDICRSTRASIKVLPGVYEIIDGRVSIDRLRPLQLEDLLHRDPVNLDLGGIQDYLKSRVVMVTGAGGSIGSELCRQVALFEPELLIMLGHGENSIHKIWQELSTFFTNLDLRVEIADIRDIPRIEYIFGKYRPDVVFHAAAHKHVPLMELHPVEAVKTNVFGTRNVAEAASRSGTKLFIFISTDKAVNPSSVMGASKLLAELIIRNYSGKSDTIFAAVRFGNVLGSNGSVVQVFREQIRKGGPVTVTHPEMTRYFMTIPEAVSLVIQAGSMAGGGEVYLLDMGEPVKIVDLAYDMIRLSGYEPERDIEIIYTGIRPGEKLYEELLTNEENSSATQHRKIYIAKPCLVDSASLDKELKILEMFPPQMNREKLFGALQRISPSLVLQKSFLEAAAGQ